MRLRDDGSWRALPRWGGIALVAAALVAIGAVAGWRLAGASVTETPIGHVSFRVQPSLTGSAEALLPVADWGLRADAFDAPFKIRAELRTLDRDAVASAAEGDLSILDAVEKRVRDGARAAALRGFAWAAATALLLLVAATLIWRRLRPRWALLGVGGALVVLGSLASLLAARATFDARAFESPTYFARGDELRRILEVAENERARSEYGSTFASILRSISTVLADEPGPRTPGRDLYVASDLHANALVVAPFARAIGNDPLLLAGDFGQRGNQLETALLARRVAALGSRVIAVSGNHDSRRLMGALAAEGVTVLGRHGPLGAARGGDASAAIEVDGLTVAGYPDPLQARAGASARSRPITFEDLPDPEAAFERAAADLVRWFDDLPRRPEIVIVHQSPLALVLAETLLERGYPYGLAIATGHDHRQHIDRFGRIVVVDGGSVGAGGVFDAGREAIGFAQLHYPGESTALRSVDLLAIEPFSGQAQASRVVISNLCPEEERCSYEPPALETSPPTERPE